MASILERIKEFNADRNKQTLALKYQAMSLDVFTFYRGSCHLFYQDLFQQSCLRQSPLTWICGDLHLENFGYYQTDNEQIYLNINDFDETVLAPCLFDISRLLVSILLATEFLNINENTATQLCKRFLKTYLQTLQLGKVQLLDEKQATGIIRDFLKQTIKLNRKDFVKTRTVKNTNLPRLLVDNKHSFELKPKLKQELINTIAAWAKNQPNPDFYDVLDIAGRIAGTGSLGLDRYIVLIKADGQNKGGLLDMKIARKSCLNSFLQNAQPLWKNEADRIIQIQKQMQVFPVALLNLIEFKQDWFVLKELQTSQYKIDYAVCKGNTNKLEEIITALASITAWNQLRSCGLNNSAGADELITFANSFSELKQPLLDESKAYAKQIKKDYKHYCKAYK